HRGTALQVAVCGHAHRDHRAAGEVATDRSGPPAAALLAEAVSPLEHPAHLHLGGKHQRGDQRRGAGPHRGHIGEIHRGRTAAHVRAGAPLAPEVPVLVQHVGGDHESAIGCGDHGGIVTAAQERGIAAGQVGLDPGEELGLVDIADAHVVFLPSGAGSAYPAHEAFSIDGYRGGVRARPFSLITLVAALLVTVSACGSPAARPPGPTASAPVCAEVLRALPEELSGAQSRSTNSQSTAAWGDPPITLRCGVQPTGPTTDRCITVKGADGAS